MNYISVSRWLLAAVAGVLLAACSSTPPAPQSPQQAPGSASRPVLSAAEASEFVPEHYFTAADEAPWQPPAIHTPKQPDFLVGPPGTPGVQYTSVQQAVNAAIKKHNNNRLYIGILPGSYSGTVYIPQASNSLTLYGMGDTPASTVIRFSIDGAAENTLWQQAVNPDGQYLPGDPGWYMYHSCTNRQPVGLFCSAVVWSQNVGLQLKNLTIENSLGDSVDAENHPAVALRSDGDRLQLDQVNLVSRQNTFFVTNSDLSNRLLINNKQPRALVTNSYIEGDEDIVVGRGAVVLQNSTFYLVNSRGTTQQYVFAPATLASLPYGFLVMHSQFIAPASAHAKLGSNWDIDSNDEYPVNGQLVIRDSTIGAGFDNASPWAAAAFSGAPFSGNIGMMEGKQFIRDANNPQFNRLWEYHNFGAGSEIVIKPKETKKSTPAQ